MTIPSQKADTPGLLTSRNRFLKSIYNEIKSVPFRGIKNVSYLSAGNFAVEIINIVGFIYIARLLGAQNYGIYVTVGTFVGMFEFVLLEGLNKSVMREGSKDLTRMHVQLENNIGIRNALILAAVIVCIVTSFFVPYALQTKLYIILFSFQLVYSGLKGFLGTIFQATEQMKYISIFGIFNRVLFVGASIIFLYLGFGLLALFLISLFSNLLTLLLNFRVSRKLIKFKLLARIHLDRKILKPGLIFSLMTFVGFLTTRVDVLMISFLGTPADVGVYGLAYRIAEQGVVLRNLIVTAFFPIFIKRFHSGTVRGGRLVRLSLLIFIAILSATFLASLLVKGLVVRVFGHQYEPSGRILEVLLFFLAFAWANMLFTTAAQATHNEKYLLIIAAIMAVANVVLNYVFFLQFGLIGIAYSTLVVTFAGTTLEILVSYRVMKVQGHLV
jgi:O-antigen/teichoic acid export membrane protein